MLPTDAGGTIARIRGETRASSGKTHRSKRSQNNSRKEFHSDLIILNSE